MALKLLDKSILLPLRLTAVELATDEAVLKKLFWI